MNCRRSGTESYVAPSIIELEGELKLARVVASRRRVHDAKQRTGSTDICAWSCPNGGVADVEGFRAKLKALRFRECKSSKDGDVNILMPISTQNVASKIPITRIGEPSLPGETCWSGEGRCVEPTSKRSDRRAIGTASGVGVANNIGTFRATIDGAVVRNGVVRKHVEQRPRGKAGDAVNLPATDDLIENTHVTSESSASTERQFINDGTREDLREVVAGKAFFRSEIIRILNGGAVGASTKPFIGTNAHGLRESVRKQIRQTVRGFFVERNLQSVIPGFANAFIVVADHGIGIREAPLAHDKRFAGWISQAA